MFLNKRKSIGDGRAGRESEQRPIEYGNAGHTRLLMDACIPRGPGPFPAVVLVHGGAWVGGDRLAMMKPLFGPLAAARIAWFTISYRFATDLLDFGDAIGDVEKAVRYVRSHAKAFRVDAKRIALVGESAGGHLAAMAALRGGLNGLIRAVVAIYSPMDLLSLVRHSAEVPGSIRNAIRGGPWADFFRARLKALSPIEHVGLKSPPFLLIHGTADNVVPFEQSVRMCERMREAGARCELYPVDGAGHGMRWWGRSRDSYKRHLVAWLEREFLAGGLAPARLPAAGD